MITVIRVRFKKISYREKPLSEEYFPLPSVLEQDTPHTRHSKNSRVQPRKNLKLICIKNINIFYETAIQLWRIIPKKSTHIQIQCTQKDVHGNCSELESLGNNLDRERVNVTAYLLISSHHSCPLQFLLEIEAGKITHNRNLITLPPYL